MPLKRGIARSRAPAQQGLEHHLGVAAAREDGALALQLGAQLAEVVDLAVVDEHALAAGRRDRLARALAQVEDAEAEMPEGDLVLGPAAAAVGSAVQHRREHAVDAARVGRLAVATQDAHQTAHGARLYHLARDGHRSREGELRTRIRSSSGKAAARIRTWTSPESGRSRDEQPGFDQQHAQEGRREDRERADPRPDRAARPASPAERARRAPSGPPGWPEPGSPPGGAPGRAGRARRAAARGRRSRAGCAGSGCMASSGAPASSARGAEEAGGAVGRGYWRTKVTLPTGTRLPFFTK